MKPTKNLRTGISKIVFVEVCIRDGWHCRYCGTEVFFSPALKALDSLNPGCGYYDKSGKFERMARILATKCAAIDHVEPLAHGGTNDSSNLVCACFACNTSKCDSQSQEWIEKISSEPTNRLNKWDGFAGLLLAIDPSNPWTKALERSALPKQDGCP